jgi:type II secretion system (T2SS) protein G
MDGSLEKPPAPDDRRWRIPLWTQGILGVALLMLVSRCERTDRRGGIHSGEGGRMYRCTKAKADIHALGAAIEWFARDHGGSYPVDLEALLQESADGDSYLEITVVPRDPWGHEYGYQPPPAGSTSYRVFSLGEDGEPGGEGYDRDLDNLLVEEGKL